MEEGIMDVPKAQDTQASNAMVNAIEKCIKVNGLDFTVQAVIIMLGERLKKALG